MYRPQTARGFRDVLPQEAAEREVISSACAEVFRSWGYGRVETPVVEEFAALEAAAGSPSAGLALRLIDAEGALLALRPDMTVPIARVVATRLGGDIAAHRLYYIADVFREREPLLGQAREFAQLGIELVGGSGTPADAEVVAVMVRALEVSGLSDFTVGVGDVAVLRRVIDAAGMPPEWGASVIEAAHRSDRVALDGLAGRSGVSVASAAALRALSDLSGDASILDIAEEVLSPCGAAGEIAALRDIADVLASLGCSSRIRFDLSIMRAFDYYTGIVFEAYVPELGVPIGGGGRYDGVLDAFGAPAAAAGFAIGLERLHMALEAQSARPAVRGLDAVVGGPANAAFAAAERLRAAGWWAAVAVDCGAADVARQAVATGAHLALLADCEGTLCVLDASGTTVSSLPMPPPAAPSLARGSDDVVR